MSLYNKQTSLNLNPAPKVTLDDFDEIWDHWPRNPESTEDKKSAWAIWNSLTPERREQVKPAIYQYAHYVFENDIERIFTFRSFMTKPGLADKYILRKKKEEEVKKTEETPPCPMFLCAWDTFFHRRDERLDLKVKEKCKQMWDNLPYLRRFDYLMRAHHQSRNFRIDLRVNEGKDVWKYVPSFWASIQDDSPREELERSHAIYLSPRILQYTEAMGADWSSRTPDSFLTTRVQQGVDFDVALARLVEELCPKFPKWKPTKTTQEMVKDMYDMSVEYALGRMVPEAARVSKEYNTYQ